jgi:putative membrane protein
MGNFFMWWFINTISIFAVSAILPGVTLEDSIGSVLLVSLIIGLVNAIVRPVLYIASCGLIILTLGLVIPILNALLLLLADSLAGSRFEVDGILWAVIAAILMGIINSVLQGLIKPERKKEEPYVIRSS